MKKEIREAYEHWQATKERQASGKQTALLQAEQAKALNRVCEAFVAETDQAYIRQHHGQYLSARAGLIFRKELHDTLSELKNMKQQRAARKLRVFLDEGCAAFIEDHLVSAGRWNQELQTAFSTVMKEEEVPDALLRALRKNSDLYERLFGTIRQILEESYNRQLREYAVRNLRKAVAGNARLKRALAQAETGFDYTAKYARQALLDYIPDDYAYLYPAARTIERHFILHIGPTNSGKTYAALQAMRRAKDGIYLAPLRLLAYEQFDSMNRDGIYCSLKTGEERIPVPGATVQSSTIEMLDERHRYDIAVIDEAQMVQDPMRGGHWTKAILGTWAKEIHVCMAPEAEQIVIRMIGQCRDTWEIIRHERFNELVPDAVTNVRFPHSVEDGDAYIVFSRASAHACVAELQKRGINPSIIYGALPYDVRQNEARRFRDGETRVVVATDAIGMGLNLPIRRVVFLETEKFDGISKRGLNATEYKQIAGRAGRYGQYEQGLYVSPFQMSRAIQLVNDPVRPIEYAHLPFPDTLLGVDAPLSTILRMWDKAPVNDGYRKEDVSQEIRLAELLEHDSADKELIYALVSMPFDAQRAAIFELWRSLAFECVRRKQLRLEKYIPDIDRICREADLEELENSYRKYDLLYYFAERFDPTLTQRLIDERKMVSALMMRILADSKLPPKTCRRCRQPIPWNSPYTICGQCAAMTGFRPMYRQK